MQTECWLSDLKLHSTMHFDIIAAAAEQRGPDVSGMLTMDVPVSLFCMIMQMIPWT